MCFKIILNNTLIFFDIATLPVSLSLLTKHLFHNKTALVCLLKHLNTPSCQQSCVARQ